MELRTKTQSRSPFQSTLTESRVIVCPAPGKLDINTDECKLNEDDFVLVVFKQNQSAAPLLAEVVPDRFLFFSFSFSNTCTHSPMMCSARNYGIPLLMGLYLHSRGRKRKGPAWV